MFTRTLTITAVFVTLSGCREGRLGEIDRQFRASPDAVLIPPTWVGDEGTAVVTASNLSRSSLTVGWTLEGGFTTDDHGATLAAGEQRPVTIRFRPQGAGNFSGTITFETPAGQASARIEATAAFAPTCVPSSECRESHFDRTTGQCVTSDVNDGQTCGATNLCLSNARCVKGACLGAATDCDDHDVCTADSCNPKLGCLHEATTASCPATNDPCKAPSCDPAKGCGISNVADGTPCGSVDCTTANICLNGTCHAVTPPDGFECSEASPCQGAGHCMNKTCVTPARVPLTRAFSVVSALQSNHPGVADENGNIYWTEIVSPPCPDIICPPLDDGGSRVCPPVPCTPVPTAQLVSVTQAGFPRYRTTLCQQPSPAGCSEWATPSARIMWSQGRVIGVSDTGAVVAVDAATGGVVWKQDVRAWIPGGSGLVRVRDAALSAQGALALAVMRRPPVVASFDKVNAPDWSLSALLLIATSNGALTRLVGADPRTEWEYVAFRANGTLLAAASKDALDGAAYKGERAGPPDPTPSNLGTAKECDARSTVSAFTAQGDLLWDKERCREAAPLAPMGPRVFTRTGWIAAHDGQWWAPAVDGGRAALGTATSTWLLSRDVSPESLLDVWPSLANWSLLSGDGTVSLATYPSISSEALLTRRGDALVVTRDGGLGAPSPGPWEVVATNPDGGTRFRCELPFPHDALEPWLTVGRLLTLRNGVLGLEVKQDCPYCLTAMPPRIEGFTLPGVDVSVEGWSAASGGLHRASREAR